MKTTVKNAASTKHAKEESESESDSEGSSDEDDDEDVKEADEGAEEDVEDEEELPVGEYCDVCLGNADENKTTGKPERMVTCADCRHSGKGS